MPEAIDTREGWLEDAVDRLRPDFITGITAQARNNRWAGTQTALPETVRVSIGFPSKNALGRRNRSIGQCWDGAAAGDSIAQVYISPLLEDPVEVLAVLVHELVHAAIGCRHGHKAPFKRAALRMGLEGKMTATTAGAELRVRLAELADALGEFPHSKLSPTTPDKKQTTRLLKVACLHCEPNYIARVTQKMLDAHGAPICPGCMAIMIEA
jgi:hypothetical protein